MSIFPFRVYQSKMDRLFRKIPLIGKLLSGIFGLLELLILESFRKFDNRFNLYTMGIFDRFILRGRWGGRVVPLNKNINVDSRFVNTQEILEILSRSNVLGVSWCYCRATQRKYNHPNCDHPLNTCIHIGFGQSLYEIPFKSENLKKVSKEEIKELIEDCDKRGLVHQLIYFPSPQFYYIVCNCCKCCCTVLKNFIERGSPRVVKSDFIAETNISKCTNCGECVDWCHFGARKLVDGKFNFIPIKCFGCGLCVSRCKRER